MKKSITTLKQKEVNTVSGGGIIRDGINLILYTVAPIVGLAIGVVIFLALTTVEKVSK